MLTAAACTVRPDGTPDGQPNPNPNPQPTSCQDEGDCNNPPSACDEARCERGACVYQTSCESNEVCNAQNLCEEETSPPPPPPPSGNGTIACTESGSQTQVTISGGILAHLFDTVTPDANWQVSMVDGYATQTPWVSDSASYVLTMPNTISNFTLAVKDPSGHKHWFDVNEFTVTGTCALGTGQFTHSTSGTPPPPGNGTISCQDVGSVTHVTVSAGILSHLFDSVTPSSSWVVAFGYGGGTDAESWVSNSVAYTLTMPNATVGFNLVLREPNGTLHWLDVSEYSVSGSCSMGTNEFRHTAASVPNGSLHCSDSGSETTVTISNGILAHVFIPFGSATPSTIRFGYGLTDTENWNQDSSTYVLTMPSTTPEFNLFVRDSNNVDHWFDVNQFNVSGTCSKTTGAFTHTAQSVGNGSLHCAESGSNTIVTVSNGILSHLVGTPSYSPSLLQFEYGGSQTLSWNGDGATYAFTMGNTITAFNLRLRDVNGNAFPFDVSEFNVSGTCSKTSTAFTHTLSTTTIVGNIHCRLWDVGGVTKREVTITPNSNGIIAGTFSEGSPVTSPESIRLNVDNQQQTWVGNGQSYIFYPLPSVNNFNFFIADNDDVASGSDTAAGGDWFNLAAWTFTNENNGLGTSNCHVSGGGIVVN